MRSAKSATPPNHSMAARTQAARAYVYDLCTASNVLSLKVLLQADRDNTVM
jgi:hypothetical protein